MNRVFTATLFVAFMICAVGARAQSLKIFHIGIGQGDCTLIIATERIKNKDVSKSVLIDTGPYSSDQRIEPIWQYIKDTLAAYGVGGLDYFVISHLHHDHMAGAVKILTKLVAEGNAWKNRINVVDRLAFPDVWTAPYGECWDNDGTATITKYEAFLTANLPTRRLPVHSGDNLFKGFKKIKMICVAANGAVDKTIHAQAGATAREARDENDLSFAFLIQFEGFAYYTGGDLGGGGGGYSNMEGPVATYMNTLRATRDFHLCAFKCGHHGSDHSTKDAFLTACNPYLAIISSALRSFSGTQLPFQTTLDRLTSKGCVIRYTYQGNKTKQSEGDPVYLRDLILYLNSAPGWLRDVSIAVKSVRRELDFSFKTPLSTTLETLVCNKVHTKR